MVPEVILDDVLGTWVAGIVELGEVESRDTVSFSIVGTNEGEEDGIGRAADSGTVADQVAGRHKSRFVGENGAWFGVFLGRVFFHIHRDDCRCDVRFFFGFKGQREGVHRFRGSAAKE
jgi:hypothetical protein